MLRELVDPYSSHPPVTWRQYPLVRGDSSLPNITIQVGLVLLVPARTIFRLPTSQRTHPLELFLMSFAQNAAKLVNLRGGWGCTEGVHTFAFFMNRPKYS